HRAAHPRPAPRGARRPGRPARGRRVVPVRAVRDGPRRQGSARSGGPAADPHRAVLRRLAPPGGPRGPRPAETERSRRTGALHRAGRSGYASSMAEIDDVLARAADGGRIGAEEAELLYTEAPF